MRAFVLACWLAVSLQGIVAGEVLYTVRDLGTAGGDWSSATAINDSGHVAGASTIRLHDGGVEDHAAVFRGSGSMQDLGALGGTRSYGAGINNGGSVAGWAYDSGWYRACVWDSAGDPHDLGVTGEANGIADNGVVVGGGFGSTVYPFVWRPGEAVLNLGTFGGDNGAANGVNELGEVVGYADTLAGAHHAFHWAPGGELQDLGTLGGSDSWARAINEQGVIVGESYLPGDAIFHAIRYTAADGMQDLGTLGGSNSRAYAINDGGQIVGSFTRRDGTEAAFVCGTTGSMQDLNELIDASLNVELYGAYGINNRGDIAADGVVGGQLHALLLTRVPEPRALALALALLLLRSIRPRG